MWLVFVLLVGSTCDLPNRRYCYMIWNDKRLRFLYFLLLVCRRTIKGLLVMKVNAQSHFKSHSRLAYCVAERCKEKEGVIKKSLSNLRKWNNLFYQVSVLERSVKNKGWQFKIPTVVQCWVCRTLRNRCCSFDRCKIKCVQIFLGRYCYSQNCSRDWRNAQMSPPYLVVHNISDCPIITLSLWQQLGERKRARTSLVKRDFMYSRKKNHLVYLQTGKSGSFFWKRGFKKKNEKTKTSLNELPIFFFFSVLLNHAAFLNVLWPLRMSPSKHSAVRGSALFVPGGVASFTVIRWWKMKDTACRMHLDGTTGVVWQQRKCSLVKYHLCKWRAGSNCWQSSCRQMFWCVNHASES